MLYILIQQRLAGTATIGDFAFILGSTFFLTDMVWSNTELLDQLNDIIGQCKQSLQSLLFCRQNYDKDSSKPSLIYKKGEIIFVNYLDKLLGLIYSLKYRKGEWRYGLNLINDLTCPDFSRSS